MVKRRCEVFLRPLNGTLGAIAGIGKETRKTIFKVAQWVGNSKIKEEMECIDGELGGV